MATGLQEVQVRVTLLYLEGIRTPMPPLRLMSPVVGRRLEEIAAALPTGQLREAMQRLARRATADQEVAKDSS